MDTAIRQLEDLYRSCGPDLLGYLRRYAPSGTAEDLLQETFAQALRRMDRLVECTSPRAWLFTIARNLRMTVWRRQRPTAAIDVEPADPAEGGKEEALVEMHEAIAQLPEKLAEALEFRLRDGLSYEEIAAVLGIPVGTVRSRLHHAVRQLREMMNNEGHHGL